MTKTIYAAYERAPLAEKAVADLIACGVGAEDISVLGAAVAAVERPVASNGAEAPVAVPDEGLPQEVGEYVVEVSGEDASHARQGAVQVQHAGVGYQALTLVGSLLVPGVGLVAGTRALVSSLCAADEPSDVVAAEQAGKELLMRQGVNERVAEQYTTVIEEGGALLAVKLTEDGCPEQQVRDIVARHGGGQVRVFEH